MYKMVLDHAGRRTHHVVEASEEGDVREAHQLGIVDSKTANANIKPSSSCYYFAPPEGIHDIDNNCGREVPCSHRLELPCLEILSLAHCLLHRSLPPLVVEPVIMVSF